MLSKQDKKLLRADLFQHLDGIVTAPTTFALYERGVLQYILEKERVQLSELVRQFNANEGYLNVALRVLAAQGWLKHSINNKTNTVECSLSEKSKTAFENAHLYKDVVHLLKFSGEFHPRKFQQEPFEVLNQIFERYYKNYGIAWDSNPIIESVQKQILKHIEGILVGPTTVHLGMSGMFHKYFMESFFHPGEFHQHPESFKKILDFLAFLGWFEEKNETYRFTEKGLFFAKRAAAYGVTVSYIPTFRKVDELIFGNPNILRDIPENSTEIHVDRAMNVWGSGGAHSAYFGKIDEIIIDLFNRPINEQPKGIVDMGCGNGAFLKHIYEVIEQRTKRGEMLEEHPLFLVGADYNQAALKATRKTLIQANIWGKVIWGDIGDPKRLANDLQEDYGIKLSDLLNVRTFLDHNRMWTEPLKRSNRTSDSTGAFAHRGQRISNNAVEDNLLEHLQKWSPYLQKFGLLVIELHTISSQLTAQNLGKTAATAYEATHGFSDQYIVEVEVFNKIAAEAGIYPDMDHFVKFPNNDLATVSINLLKGS